MTEADTLQRLAEAVQSDDANGLFIKFLDELAARADLRAFAQALEFWRKAQRERYPYAHSKVRAILLNHFFLSRGVTPDQLHKWNEQFNWSSIERHAAIASHFPIAVSAALESLTSHATGGPIVIPGPSAYFQFQGEGVPDVFVIKLIEQPKIDHARRVLRGQEKSKVHVQGIIVKQPVVYNPPWSYYLDPASISFWEMAIEVCDAAMAYVEQHLDEVGGATLPNGHWCPWDSKLISELIL